MTLEHHARDIGRQLAILAATHGYPNRFGCGDPSGEADTSATPQITGKVAQRPDLVRIVRAHAGHHVEVVRGSWDGDRYPFQAWAVGASHAEGPLGGLFVLVVKPEQRGGRGLYWRAKGAGYTNAIACAGLYTEEQIRGDRCDAVPAVSAVLDAMGSAGRDWPAGFTWEEAREPDTDTVGGRLGIDLGTIVRAMVSGQFDDGGLFGTVSALAAEALDVPHRPATALSRLDYVIKPLAPGRRDLFVPLGDSGEAES